MTASVRIARAALAGGLSAAILDLLGAIALTAARGGDPLRAVQSIASGFLGRSAYQGGAATAALGAAIHVGIAMSMATAYMLAAWRWRGLARRPWLWGPLYGLLMWAVMYLVVLPLRWPRNFPQFSPADTIGQLGCHVFLVGLPIAYAASRLLVPRGRVD